jgi:hypothetical protein
VSNPIDETKYPERYAVPITEFMLEVNAHSSIPWAVAEPALLAPWECHRVIRQAVAGRGFSARRTTRHLLTTIITVTCPKAL